MNRIVVDKVIKQELDDSIIFNNNKLDILKSTTLELDVNDVCNLVISIKPNIDVTIINIENTKEVSYLYNIAESSKLNLEKINDEKDIKEETTINLNGISASVNYVFKTISDSSENYTLVVNHNASKTSANIINHGVNIKDGNLVFDVSNYIPSSSVDCYANQINRIINLTDNKCIIRPNLYIDCYDVTANHSALIGRFSDAEMFYLESRGISPKDTTDLLTKGFLYSNITSNDIKELIEDEISEI